MSVGYFLFSCPELEHIACQLLIFAACARPSGSYVKRRVDRISARDFELTDFRCRVRSPGSKWEPLIIHCLCLPIRHLRISLVDRITVRDFGVNSSPSRMRTNLLWLVDHGKNSVNLRVLEPHP